VHRSNVHIFNHHFLLFILDLEDGGGAVFIHIYVTSLLQVLKNW
jgi:hypothetical protein